MSFPNAFTSITFIVNNFNKACYVVWKSASLTLNLDDFTTETTGINWTYCWFADRRQVVGRRSNIVKVIWRSIQRKATVGNLNLLSKHTFQKKKFIAQTNRLIHKTALVRDIWLQARLRQPHNTALLLWSWWWWWWWW